MITTDTSFFDCPTIDTDEWLAKVTDREVTDEFDAAYNLPADDGELPLWGNEYDADEVARIAQRFGLDDATSVARDNTYNSENNFSADFVFEVFCDSDDWAYGLCLIAINPHLGGDPRGNYGAVRWFVVDAPAETGFWDWVLGVTLHTADGERVECDEFDIGYTSAPVYSFESDSRTRVVGYSEKRGAWLAWFDGRAVEVGFYTSAEWR